DAPLSPDRSLSPIAFMFAGAAAFGVVHAMIGLKAPEMELPEAASLLQQVVSGLGKNIESLLCVAFAGVAAVFAWAAFRLFRLRLTWQAAMRHTAYCSGVQSVVLLVLVLPDVVAQFTLRSAPLVADQVATLVWLLSYLFLNDWTFRQYVDECRTSKLRALPAFLIAGVPFWAILIMAADAGPDLWVSGVIGMKPGIDPADIVHIDRWVLAARDPRPGEVVTVYPKNAGHPWVLAGGALRTVAHHDAFRVIAVPGDMVAADGADLIVNGVKLKREVLPSREHGTEEGEVQFRQQIGERRPVVVYGAHQEPKPCLSPSPVNLPQDGFLLALDDRSDGQLFCGHVTRSSLSGVIDWNVRTRSPP
ncbi:MAG: hypothetical protein JOZ42_13535, partial [Acetobacteraceae bacterium]|nr:hypothetical protein [Acetobacteraceae bacterium]